MPVIAVIMAAAMAAPIASRGPALFVAAPFCVFVMNAKTKTICHTVAYVVCVSLMLWQLCAVMDPIPLKSPLRALVSSSYSSKHHHHRHAPCHGLMTWSVSWGTAAAAEIKWGLLSVFLS